MSDAFHAALLDPPNRRLRRIASSKRAHKKYPPLREKPLTDRAHKILTDNLTRFGSRLTVAHQDALMRVVGRFTHLASGVEPGRWAYDLPCGAGKSQAIVAWAAAAHELDKPYSVQVSASKVEALCDLKRDMISNGVPEEKIGLIHSYENRASLPPTEGNDQRPILLVSHNRVKMRNGGDPDQYLYRGKQRDFVIWDESLITSEHRAIERIEIKSGIGWLKPRIGDPEGDLAEAYRYLVRAETVLDDEYEAQRRQGRDPVPIFLPEASADDIDRYVRSLSRYWGVVEPLKQLLRISQQQLRVVDANLGGGGYVHYDIVIPKNMMRMAILDASFPIRDLEQMDRKIKRDTLFTGSIKTHEAVTINHMYANSGRGAMNKAFSPKREDRKVTKDIIDVIRGVPDDQAMIVFTFKPKDDPVYRRKRGALDMAKVLQEDLEHAGIDTKAKVTVTEKGETVERDRFVWLTWGQETSVSAFQYASNVIFAGVLHRSEVELAGAMIGQSDDLMRDVSHSDVLKVQRSEIVHSLYQAMSRGSARITIDGKAAPMNVWLIHPDEAIRPLIDTVMPGVVWQEWKPKHLKGTPRDTKRTAERIVAFLRALPDSEAKVSMRILKGATNDDKLSGPVFQTARDKALATLPEWKLEGRSLVRT